MVKRFEFLSTSKYNKLLEIFLADLCSSPDIVPSINTA